MKTKKEILHFLADNNVFFKENFNIIRVGIFGSYSRGDATNDSDIDLVVEFEADTSDLYDKKNLLKDYIRENLGLKADLCREKYIKPIFRSTIIRETDYTIKAI